MEPTAVATSAMASGLPSATSWYMNPYFMASFGAVVALGFVLFALAYFVFVKLKVGQPAQVSILPEDRCNTCGLTAEMISKMVPCKEHGETQTRLKSLENWKEEHGGDYRELRRRVDAIERGDKRGG